MTTSSISIPRATQLLSQSRRNMGPAQVLTATDRRRALQVGLAAALAFLLFQAGEVTVSDGSDMLAVTQSLIHHGSAAVGSHYGVPGVGGHYFAKYGIGLSLVVLPFVAAGDVLALVIGHQANLESFMAASVMPLIMGLLVAALWRTTRRLGATRNWATVVALGGALGTYALPYGKDFFSEPLVALAIVVAIESCLTERYRVAGAALGLAVMTRPESLVVVAAFCVTVLLLAGIRNAILLGAAASVGTVIEAGYNLYRFGSPLKSGYGNEGFTNPFLSGVHGLLLNPEKSILLFAPIVILMVPTGLRLWRHNRIAVLLITINFCVFFVLAALWDSWQGGWSWGPRLVLPGVIAGLPLLASATQRQRRLAVALFVLGFLVSAPTVLVPVQAQTLNPSAGSVGPEIVRQYQLMPTVVRYTGNHLHASHVAGAHRRYLSLWQVNLGRELGRKGLLIGVVGSLLVLAALIALLRRTSILGLSHTLVYYGRLRGRLGAAVQ